MHINLDRRKPSFSSIKIIYLYLSHTCLEGHPWLFKRALPFTFLQCPLTFVSFKRPAFCSRSETYRVSMSFSHLFLMPLLFLQSPLCSQGEKTRLLKENKTRRKVADVHFFYPGGRVGEDSWEAWEEGVQYCGVETFPKVFGTPTEELAVDRPSFCLKYGPLFFPFLIGCMTSRCYFCLIWSSLVMCLYHECVWVSFLPLHCWNHAWCGWTLVSVCAYIYLLPSRCFCFHSPKNKRNRFRMPPLLRRSCMSPVISERQPFLRAFSNHRLSSAATGVNSLNSDGKC